MDMVNGPNGHHGHHGLWTKAMVHSRWCPLGPLTIVHFYFAPTPFILGLFNNCQFAIIYFIRRFAMTPIENNKYSDDYNKFLQNQIVTVNIYHPLGDPKRPFSVEPADKAEKGKKDLKKEKDQKKKDRPFQ